MERGEFDCANDITQCGMFKDATPIDMVAAVVLDKIGGDDGTA